MVERFDDDLKGFSMQAWRMRALLLAIIIMLPFEIELLIALWPYLSIVGKAFAGLLTTLCICGAILAVAYTWHWIGILAARKRGEKRRSRVIEAAGLAVLELADGTFRHLSAEQEAAKLALPAPVPVTEQSEDDDEVLIAKVRLFHDVGYSIQRIATETGLKPWKVQRWTSEYERTKKAKGQSQIGQAK